MRNKMGRKTLLLTITLALALLFVPTAVSAPKPPTEANRGQIGGVSSSTLTGGSRETDVKPTLDPALVPICTCESGRGVGHPVQFNADGSVRRGLVNPQDVGMCQINEHYHLAAAQALGMDIYTEVGNIEYANYLYEHEGTTPWNWSKSCWAK